MLKETTLKSSDFTLDDAEVLTLASRLAPALFTALRVAHVLRQRLPIASKDDLLRSLFDDGIVEQVGYCVPREHLDDMCFAFPLTDHAELIRRLYIAAGHTYEKAQRPTADVTKEVP